MTILALIAAAFAALASLPVAASDGTASEEPAQVVRVSGAEDASVAGSAADPAGPAETPRPRARPKLSEEQRSLLERPDEQRFDEGPSVPVFGRPLIFGGQYTLRTRYEDDRLAKDGDTVDFVRLNQDGHIDAFYPWSEELSAYVRGRFVNRNLIWSSKDDSDHSWDVGLGEGWIFLGSLFGTPLSLQVGRQRIFDEREWWWDENVDAVRLHFDRERIHAEVAVADQVAPISTDDQDRDPEDEDHFLVLGRGMFEWAKNQQMGVYGLHRHDHSSPHRSGEIIDKDDEDKSDGDFTWLGVSALGRRQLGRLGGLSYWFDGAYMWGQEEFFDFVGPSDRRELRPQRIHSHTVSGWGIDAGATWELRLPLRPTLTLGYARGSGERGMQEQTDTGFRQTGLEGNNWKWRGGVNRFKYYGEILEPELSNLQVATAAIGIRLLRNSSVTLAWHHFRQVEAADFLRNVNIGADPDGQHRTIGQEWNLILGIEEWRHLQLEIIGGIFRAGPAFGPVPNGDPLTDRVRSQEGDLSYLGLFQLRANF